MKTIFRLTNVGLLLAVMIALGAVAGMAQNPCEDATGMSTASDAVRADFAVKTLPGRKKFVETAKAFVEKYGACEAATDMATWAKNQIPKTETTIKEMEVAAARDAILTRFNNALKTKNWDELYASGKEILAQWPDEFRPIEIALGTVGLDETIKNPPVTKWNDETIRFAKQSIQDIEAGKPFKVKNDKGEMIDSWGLSYQGGANLSYKDKDAALGWLNYTIGYILFHDKKNKKEAMGYLYKASQYPATKDEAAIYDAIGAFFFEDVLKLSDEIDALIKTQVDTDTPEQRAQKIEAIKAKVAIFNGTAEASIDGYARAYELAKKNPKFKTYTDGLLAKLKELYNGRFKKMDGFDAFIAGSVKKPLPNPLDPIKPIVDPEAVKTTTTTTSTTTPVPPAPIKPGPTSTAAPSPSGPAAKPAAAPAKNGIKPRASVKKKATAKRIAE